MKCPICEGEGGWTNYVDVHTFSPRDECPHCKGTGGVNLLQWCSLWFWKHVPIWLVEWIDNKGE